MNLYRVAPVPEDEPDQELEVLDELEDGLRGLHMATAIWRLVDEARGDALDRLLSDAMTAAEARSRPIVDADALRRILGLLDGLDEAAESIADSHGFLPPDKADAAKAGYPEVGEELEDEHGRRGYSLINSLARVAEARLFLEESLRQGAATVMD